MESAYEFAFQNEMIRQLLANGWQLGKPEKYNLELVQYEEDLQGYIQENQDEQWKNSKRFTLIIPNRSF